MRHSNKSLFVIIVLALVLVGFYTVDFNGSNQASVLSLPDFDTQVEAAKNQPINNLSDLNDAVVNVAEKTNPTVVTIFTTQTVEQPQNPLFRFFGDPRGGGGMERQVTGLGSGVIISEDGYIVTNNHVVEAADEIRVETYDGSDVEAEVVGTDPRTDIAVLKISGENLPTIDFGNSDSLRVGEFVMAIGSPFGEQMAHSVSFGIVSGKGRVPGLLSQQEVQGYENFIQTDAAINPGNSGGALINLDGKLVGINTAIASRSGGNQGIGFAIPANLVQNISNQLIEKGEVTRAYLGIFGRNIDGTMAEALNLSRSQGALVHDVVDDTPAEEAGLQEGDVIVSLNGQPVDDYNVFRTEIASKQPGTEVTLGVVRDGEEMEIAVTLGELPDEGPASGGGSPNQDIEENVGFNVRTLTDEIAQQLNLEPGIQGVVVTQIARGSDAYRQGLRQGDVITSVAREQVTNVEEFNRAIGQYVQQEGDQAVLLRVIRGGNGLFIAFEL